MKRRLVPRKFERSAAIGEALVRPLAASPRVRVSVLNLAQSGAALFTTCGMKVGETVEMAFHWRRMAIRVNGLRVTRALCARGFTATAALWALCFRAPGPMRNSHCSKPNGAAHD